MAAQASPNRNTLNQRASRARRKDYIRDLECRLHAYEARGVQVTTEVQAAARKVADENSALREEVRLLRDSCAVLERRIEVLARGEANEIHHGRPRGTGVAVRRKRAEASPVQREARQRHTKALEPTNSDEPTEQIAGQDSLLSPPVPDVLATDPDVTETADVVHGAPVMANTTSPWYAENASSPSLDHDTITPEYPSPISLSQAHTPSPLPGSSTTPTNSTPCLQAALIIASMRGVPSDAEIIETNILRELGCAGPEKTQSCAPPRYGQHGSTDWNLSERPGRSGTCNAGNQNAFPDCAVDNGRLFGILAHEG